MESFVEGEQVIGGARGDSECVLEIERADDRPRA